MSQSNMKMTFVYKINNDLYKQSDDQNNNLGLISYEHQVLHDYYFNFGTQEAWVPC